MTKDELIANQQLEIEEMKSMLKENTQLIQDIRMSFFAIGQPLNDNALQFNKEQQGWCFNVVGLIEQLNGL